MMGKLKEADGIFASNDPTTVGMLGALKSKGLVKKVKFVGFDADTAACSVDRNMLTIAETALLGASPAATNGTRVA